MKICEAGNASSGSLLNLHYLLFICLRNALERLCKTASYCKLFKYCLIFENYESL